jgi:hypothetical protein
VRFSSYCDGPRLVTVDQITFRIFGVSKGHYTRQPEVIICEPPNERPQPAHQRFRQKVRLNVTHNDTARDTYRRKAGLEDFQVSLISRSRPVATS